METGEKSLLDKLDIFSLWPVIAGALLIFYSSLRAYTYYYEFNVDIFNFLSSTELITFFLKDIYLYSFVLPVLLLYIINRISRNNESKILATESFWNSYNRPRLKKMIWIFAIGVVLNSIVITLGFGFKNGAFYTLWLLVGGMTGIFLIIKKHRTYFLIMILMICYITQLAVGLSVIDALFVKRNVTDKKICIEFNDGTVFESDSLNIFVGKTERYVFVYNNKEKMSSVYNSEDVRKFSVSKVEY